MVKLKNTPKGKPFWTLRLITGGAVTLLPNLITEILERKKFRRILCGHTWYNVYETKDDIEAAVTSARKEVDECTL